MNEWVCNCCGLHLVFTTTEVASEECPVCQDEGVSYKLHPKYEWLSQDVAIARLEQGQPLAEVYVEALVLDGVIFEHPVKINNSLIGAWSSREAEFQSVVDLSGSIILTYFQTGSGQSKQLGRYAFGAHFSDDFVITEANFVQGGSFEGCQFDGAIQATKAQLSERLALPGIEVSGDADFTDAVLDIVVIQNARFKSKLLFERVVCKRDVNITSLFIGQLFLLSKTHFQGELYIGESSFGDEVNFAGAIFDKIVSFDSVEFEGGIEFDSVRFHAPLEMTQIECHGWFDFEWARCQEKVYFEGITFWNVVSFEDTIFTDDVTFRIANFQQETFFRRTQFKKALSIILGRFRERVDFRDVKFMAPLFLERVTFTNTAYFANSYFADALSWTAVSAERGLQAKRMVVQGTTSLKDCTLSTDIVWSGSVFHQDFMLTKTAVDGCLDLREVEFKATADVTDSQIKQLRLQGMIGKDLVINFAQVKDHLLSEQQRDWDVAAEEWEIVRLSFEQRNRALDVDNAYYKKRQAENRSSKKRLPARIVERVFLEWGTGYSTRPVNVFVLSLVIILVFAVVDAYLFTYVIPAAEGIPPDERVPLSSAVLFSFSVFSQIDPSEAIVAIEAFIGGFLVALFTTLLTRKVFRQ